MQLQSILLSGLALIPAAIATNLHVNIGCILIDGATSICNGASTSILGGSAQIEARFDGNDKSSPEVQAGCCLHASWPPAYGDIFFGADNCLYDAQGQNIGGQCCDIGTAGQDLVKNPYSQGT